MAWVDIAGIKNSFTYSTDFNNSAWSKNECTISSNAIVAPDGSLTADELIESATTNVGHSVSKTTGGVGAQANGSTFSIFVKAKTRSKFYIGLAFNPNSITVHGTYDLVTGVATGGNVYGHPINYSYMQKLENGWWRCILQIQTGGGAFNPVCYFGTIDDGGDKTPAVGEKSLYIWGAMWEETPESLVDGTNHTRFIETGSSTVVEGSLWQYENTATVSDTYPDSADGANSIISGGIRTYTSPDSSSITKTYIRTRKKGTTTESGELSYTHLQGK